MNSNNPEILTLISAANSKFYPGLLVALATAIEHASGRYNYHVKVLNGGLTEEEVADLTEKLKNIGQLRGIAVDVENRILTTEELALLPSRRGSPLTNARLLVPQLFPAMSKAVYLDSDVLCGRGIEEFHEALDENCALSACLDPHRIVKSDRTTRTKTDRDQWQMPYFNAGVIGINVNRWRRDFEEIKKLLGAPYEWKHADQSLLNFLYRGQWNRVVPEANVCLTLRNCAENDFSQQKANIHYIGPVKPWLSQQSSFYRFRVDQLFDAASQRLLGGARESQRTVEPSSWQKAKRKALWYRFFQPERGRLYKMALQQCESSSSK